MIDAIKSAYRVAFLGIIGATVRYHCEQGITDKVDFVFDDQGADFDRAYDCFQHVRRTDPYLTDLIVAGSPRSGTDDQILPLQAADRLVWQLRFHFARTNAEKGISANEDKLFITAVPTFPAQADGPPILVDIWDSARLSECHSANRESFREIYRKHFPGFETTDFADEMKERIRQLLPYRF
jgi:hypothetical protein